MIRIQNGDLQNTFNVFRGKKQIGRITLHMRGNSSAYSAECFLTNAQKTFSEMDHATAFLKNELQDWINAADLRRKPTRR